MATYIFTDLHGQYQLWQKIKDFLKPEDRAYCLGDCTDRGSDGILILLEILRDDRITLLKGNHEALIETIIPEFLEGDFTQAPYWFVNGGEETWETLLKMPEEEARGLISKIGKLPERIDIDNEKGQHLVLTHAGTNPWRDPLTQKFHSYLWDRDHIHLPWNKSEEYNDTYVIHGHTPVLADDALFLNMEGLDKEKLLEDYRLNDVKKYKENPTIARYYKGHKICLDLGSFATNKVALFNADTFETIYFTGE